MRIDDKFMNEVGLEAMPAEEKRAFMEQAEEEFEVRVGQNIGALMTDAQLEAFDQITDPSEAADFLDEFVPDYRNIVLGIFEAFKKELLSNRQGILG